MSIGEISVVILILEDGRPLSDGYATDMKSKWNDRPK